MITHCGEPEVGNGLLIGVMILVGVVILNVAALIAMCFAFGLRGFLISVACQVFTVLVVVILCARCARQKS